MYYMLDMLVSAYEKVARVMPKGHAHVIYATPQSLAKVVPLDSIADWADIFFTRESPVGEIRYSLLYRRRQSESNELFLGTESYQPPLFAISYRPEYKEDFQNVEEAIARSLGANFGEKYEREGTLNDDVTYKIRRTLQMQTELTADNIANLFANAGLNAQDVGIRESYFTLPWNLRSTLRSLANRSSGSSSGNEFLIYANKIKA